MFPRAGNRDLAREDALRTFSMVRASDLVSCEERSVCYGIFRHPIWSLSDCIAVAEAFASPRLHGDLGE